GQRGGECQDQRGVGIPPASATGTFRRALLLRHMRSVVPTRATLSAMTPFTTTRRPRDRTAVAPDGSDVRVLLGLAGGGMAEFELAAGQVAAAVTHRTVEACWYVVECRCAMS